MKKQLKSTLWLDRRSVCFHVTVFYIKAARINTFRLIENDYILYNVNGAMFSDRPIDSYVTVYVPKALQSIVASLSFLFWSYSPQQSYYMQGLEIKLAQA